MRIRKLMTLLGIVSVLCTALPRSASAHVLIADTTGKSGAIMHVTPNDDPVAGESTSIFFDVKTNEDLSKANVQMVVTSQNGGIEEQVPVSADKHTVSGAFIFPIRGVYYITVTIGSKINGERIEPKTFRTTLQVAKSKTGANPSQPVPEWARVGLLLSVWCLTALVLIAFKKRKSIASNSK